MANKNRLRARIGSQPIVTAIKFPTTANLPRNFCAELGFLGGFAAAAAAGGGLSGSFADEFGGPDGSDEFFYAVIVKIDRGAIGV